MSDTKRAIAREIAQKHLEAGDALGWFEALYVKANRDPSIVPWADLEPNPSLVDWLSVNGSTLSGEALIVGCGLGDDAEELARWGLETLAFDISATAIGWCKKRFPKSMVTYQDEDLLLAPCRWQKRFDFVLESYTFQVLPPDLREKAIAAISSFVAPGGILLVLARGREKDSSAKATMAWPVTKAEISLFGEQGLKSVTFEDYMDKEEPPVRRFRATYKRV